MEELRRQREEQERRERAERERLAKLKAEQERQRKLAEQRRAEQQRLAAQQNKAAQQQQPEEVASSKPERGSGISSAGYYSGLKTNGSLRWPVQGPILIAYGSPRTAELKWKGT